MIDMSDIPIKEWMPAFISGLFAVFVAVAMMRQKKGSELRSRDWAREQLERAEQGKSRELEITQNVSQAQDMTARFRTLMESYEALIKELTAELAKCKNERDAAERLYDDRQVLCNVCPRYLEHVRTRDARPAT